MGFKVKTFYKAGAYFREGYGSKLKVVRLLQDGDIEDLVDVLPIIVDGVPVSDMAVQRICLRPYNPSFHWIRCKKDGSSFSRSEGQKKAQLKGAALGRLIGLRYNLRTTLSQLTALYERDFNKDERQIAAILNAIIVRCSHKKI